MQPLPRCDYCGIHISVDWLINHRRTMRFNKAVEMRLRWKDVGMVKRCGDMDFNLYGREGRVLM